MWQAPGSNVIMLNQLRWLWLSAAVFLLDQASKVIALTQLVPYEPKYLLPILNIDLLSNTGAAFSFLKSASGWQRWFFIGIAVAASVAILRWLQQLPRAQNLTACALALILGGALGNVFDRLLRGAVVDFIQLHYQQWYFPTFNLADSAITIGVVLWLLVIAKKESK
jgi:signal peptidase II